MEIRKNKRNSCNYNNMVHASNVIRLGKWPWYNNNGNNTNFGNNTNTNTINNNNNPGNIIINNTCSYLNITIKLLTTIMAIVIIKVFIKNDRFNKQSMDKKINQGVDIVLLILLLLLISTARNTYLLILNWNIANQLQSSLRNMFETIIKIEKSTILPINWAF